MKWPVFALIGLIFTLTWLQFEKHQRAYTTPIDRADLAAQYQRSQYVNPDSSDWIEDPPLYTLAGIEYIEGQDPSTINFELQPLTKYLFGLTTLLVGNPLPFQLFLYSVLILQTYLLTRKLIGHDYLALVPATLIGFDPLIRLHSHTAYLDLGQTVAIMAFLLVGPSASAITIGLLIGTIALTKSFMIGALVFVAWVTFLFVQSLDTSPIMFKSILDALSLTRMTRKMPIIKIFSAALVSIGTYFLGYAAFFLHGKNLFDFASLHIDIVRLYRSYVPEYPKGEFLRILFFGQWRTWWGDKGLIAVSEWWLVWPLATVAALIGVILMKIKTLSPHLLLTLIFMLLYAVSIGLKLVFPRYLIPILPLLYIVATHFFAQLVSKRVQ